ncbi:hypothetical protein Droror1_Dr00002804 [Drosera rotundifolia]
MVSVIRPSPFFLEKCMTSRNIAHGRLGLHNRMPCFFQPETRGPNSTQVVETMVLKSYATHAISVGQSFDITQTSHFDTLDANHSLALLADLDPATAKLAIPFIGPFLSAFGFLFVMRIVMSWYPKLPVGEFPYVLAYAPTEPLLAPTRKVIPPVGGVDVTPVVWFGLVSFLSEILVGPQGLLVLLSQQV